MCDLFLDNHSHGSDHGKTSVVQFFVGHGLEFLRISWLEVHGIESKIAWVVVVIQLCEPCFSIKAFFILHGNILFQCISGEFPSNLSTGDFSRGDTSTKPREEERSDVVNLGEVSVGRSSNGSIEEWVERFSDKVSNDGKHGDASVGDLCLTESLDFLDREILGESERIELSERGDGTRKASAKLLGVGRPAVDSRVDLLGFFNFGLNGGSEEGRDRGRRAGCDESGGGSDDERESDDRLHFIFSLTMLFEIAGFGFCV